MKYFTQRQGTATEVWWVVGAAREHIATFKRGIDAEQYATIRNQFEQPDTMLSDLLRLIGKLEIMARGYHANPHSQNIDDCTRRELVLNEARHVLAMH